MTISEVTAVSGAQAENLEAQTLCGAFQATVAAYGDRPALGVAGESRWITWNEYAERVRRIAGGLAALGVGRGEAVALMMTNRPEFNLCDTAAFHLGAAPFSVYNTLSADQIAYLFANADNRVVVCERAFLDVVRAAAADSAVEHVVCLDEGIAGTISLGELETRDAPGFDFDATWRAVEGDDVLTLIYTSGTTGPPKGVELTHTNIIAQCRGVADTLPVRAEGRILSFLPSAHIADRWLTHYNSVMFGAAIATLADIKELPAVLPKVRPTYWGAVPRVWEKMKAALEAQGITDPAALPDEVKAQVRAKLGIDQAEWNASGAAPIPVPVLEFFAGLGVEICEVWGMSELSCIATLNPPGATKFGTVGLPIDGVELKLADDGELLVRGPTVMRGYRKMPEKTAETIDADGWLATGDIATIDEDGYVSIVDRKKEIIINASGKNISPANVEQTIKAASPLIGQAVAIGDRRPYVTALITLDPDVAPVWAKENGIDSSADLASEPAVIAEVQRGVDAANAELARVEQVRRFELLGEQWLPGGDELTPTMKLKRKPINEKYAEKIERLYQ